MTEREARRTCEDAGLTVGKKEVAVGSNFVPSDKERLALETLRVRHGYRIMAKKISFT